MVLKQSLKMFVHSYTVESVQSLGHLYIIHLQTEAEYFGIDWGGPVPVNNLDTTVSIPETNCPLSAGDL